MTLTGSLFIGAQEVPASAGSMPAHHHRRKPLHGQDSQPARFFAGRRNR
ncbi:hypothetical protein SAMN04487926_109287 [Paraburkholderia steynii]|uniref:Uncharacterized protein n=1 Tax=Paraburkholderia steynii TaxID=1245441 RepID=A0A7Z7FHK8_9BURK|nr:hypothetical protein SAMN04487926_109287 [Paraburkholderia steynii]